MTNNKNSSSLHKEVIKQIITLATTSFGLVAALAWNEAIKEYVSVFIKPYFNQGSGVISLLIYALVITAVTVIITIQSAKILNKIDATK